MLNMRYKFSSTSKERLASCHHDLQVLFNEVIIHIDCTVIIGIRSEAEQNLAFKEGASDLEFPLSKHNRIPSQGVDVAPYPIKWKKIKRFYYFGGFVNGIADRLFAEGKMSHRIRWGGDWDGDNDFSDQKLNDLVHFGLLGPNP